MSTTSIEHHSGPRLAEDARRLNDDHGQIAPGEIAIGVVIGRASEYFDFFVYGIASALVFPQIFFPFEQGLEATLFSFVVFAFAFVARPIGTVIFMKLQSRYGREAKLTVALFLLGTSTAGIAFLPNYGSIGFTAIVLLSMLRFLQGIALGGSWDGLPSLLAAECAAGEARLVRGAGPNWVRRSVSCWRPGCSPSSTPTSRPTISSTGAGATPSMSPSR